MARDADPGAAIELQGVVKEFGAQRALDGVDLTVPRGAITVLLGPSGAGKTVTINHIVGLLQPTKGVVRVEGTDLATLSEDELNRMRRTMSVAMQGGQGSNAGLFFSIDVFENVAYPLRERTNWSDEQIHEVAMEHLAMVGLKDRARHMPHELSAGERRRTALARAFALNARIVLIDDFDSGIDHVRLALLTELIRDAHEATGATFVVTTHDMKAARRLADHAAVIHRGRIIESGPADAVFTSTEPAARQLVSGASTGPIGMSSD